MQTSLYRICSRKSTLRQRFCLLDRCVRNLRPFALSFPLGLEKIFNNNNFCVVKTGYPPRPLTLIPELPLSSLGLERGDQIIVNDNGGSTNTTTGQAPKFPLDAPSSPPYPTTIPPSSSHSRPKPPQASVSSGPDYIEVDGSFLIHRVQQLFPCCCFFGKSSLCLIPSGRSRR